MDNSSIVKTSPATAPLVEILHQLMRYWYWFAISMALAIGIGYLYTKTISYEYGISALILLRDSATSSSGISEEAIFSDMGITSSISSVDNEIMALKSSSLMLKTVERLGLTTQYKVKPLLREADIYSRSPIFVTWLDENSVSNQTIFIEIVSPQHYRVATTDSFDDAMSANLGDSVTLNSSRFIVTPTANFGNGFTENIIQVTRRDKLSVANELLAKLFVGRTDRATGAIVLSISDNNITRGEQILNTLIEVYDEAVIDQRSKVAQNTEEFIAERIALIYSELGEVDEQIADFKQENRIVSTDNISSNALQRIAEIQHSKRELNMQMLLIEGVSNQIGDGDENQDLILSNYLFAELGVEEQIDIYNSLLLKLGELERASGGKNPILIRLKGDIETARSNILIAIKSVVRSLEEQMKILDGELSNLNARLTSVPVKEMIVKDVMREQSIKEQLYLYLLNKRETNALQLAVTKSNTTILEPARALVGEIAPNTPMIMLVAALIGFLLPALTLFIRASLDNKIRTKSDIEAHSSLPILGTIPKKSKEQADSDIIVAESARDPLSESFRVVRSNLNFFDIKPNNTRAAIIQFTSSISGEGKTFSSLNLALTTAQTGSRTLLIDLDLRRRGLSKIIETEGIKSRGLTTYLSGNEQDLDAIITTDALDSSLDFINAGTLAPNAVGLLSSARFRSMIATLRERYDYIILDTAPFFAVADSQIINSIADITVWVLRLGMAQKKLLPELEKLTTESRVKKATLLITDVDNSATGYGYGYGYGNDEGEGK